MMRTDGRTAWVRTEPGMYVGTTDGRVCGYVVEARDTFVSFTSGQAPIGRFDTLEEAERAATVGR